MYAEANRDEVDVKPSLMLAQSALELLSWLTLVESGAISADGFRALTASDHIRLLLRECRVPSAIPPLLEDLAKAARGSKLDGPAILVEVRNGLVHPGKKRSRNITPFVLTQAWHLSMWYLELALLHVFEYRGQYCNRLKVSMGMRPFIETVPWVAI